MKKAIIAGIAVLSLTLLVGCFGETGPTLDGSSNDALQESIEAMGKEAELSYNEFQDLKLDVQTIMTSEGEPSELRQEMSNKEAGEHMRGLVDGMTLEEVRSEVEEIRANF